MHLCMIWMAALNSVCMDVLRTGRLVGETLIKCKWYCSQNVHSIFICFLYKSSHEPISLMLQNSNIGLPFYGRSFAGPGLTGWGQTHSGYADTITFADDEGSPQCKFKCSRLVALFYDRQYLISNNPFLLSVNSFRL